MKEINQPMDEIVTVQLQQLEWPDVLNDCFPHEILTWLIMESLSSHTLETAARKRIHVMAKPRTRTDNYWVAGGFLAYLHLLGMGWDKDIECVIDRGADSKKIIQYFSNDIHLSLFSTRGGSISAAAKAAVLIALNKLASDNQYPMGVLAPYGMLKKRNQALLKELVGFDARSYRRASKEDIPPKVLGTIESILGLAGSVAPKKDQTNDDDLI